jgi:hypothetical protein
VRKACGPSSSALRLCHSFRRPRSPGKSAMEGVFGFTPQSPAAADTADIAADAPTKPETRNRHAVAVSSPRAPGTSLALSPNGRHLYGQPESCGERRTSGSEAADTEDTPADTFITPTPLPRPFLARPVRGLRPASLSAASRGPCAARCCLSRGNARPPSGWRPALQIRCRGAA